MEFSVGFCFVERGICGFFATLKMTKSAVIKNDKMRFLFCHCEP